MLHTLNVDWRKPMIGILAGLAALGQVYASGPPSTIAGGMWLSVFMASATAGAILVSPAIKKTLEPISKGNT